MFWKDARDFMSFVVYIFFIFFGEMKGREVKRLEREGESEQRDCERIAITDVEIRQKTKTNEVKY